MGIEQAKPEQIYEIGLNAKNIKALTSKLLE